MENVDNKKPKMNKGWRKFKDENGVDSVGWIIVIVSSLVLFTLMLIGFILFSKLSVEFALFFATIFAIGISIALFK